MMSAAASTTLVLPMVSGRRNMRSNMPVIAVVGILLCAVCHVIPVAEAVTQPKCKGNLQTDAVILCHIRPGREPYQCPDNQGLVVGDLFIAPLSEYQDGCDSFHNNNLLQASCLKESTPQYDQVVFDILEKVSGKQMINSSLVVDRFHFQTETVVNDSSAFVAFRKMCKKNKDTSVLNMCSNMSDSNNRVYLTLQDTPDIPSEPSLCRCTVRPAKDLKLDLKALDVRLQNKLNNQQCGTTSLKISSGESKPERDISCRGKESLHSPYMLYSSKRPNEVTLTLTSVNSTEFPTAVWIEISQEYIADAQMIVTCEGFVPLPVTTKPTVTDGFDKGGGVSTERDGDGEEGGDLLLVPIIIGPLVFVILIIVLIVVIRRRRRACRCNCAFPFTCCCEKGEKGSRSYFPVHRNEPIYAEAGGPSYQFPADAKFLANGRPEYAEPDSGGNLDPFPGKAPGTPPPLPDEPCPKSPPASDPIHAQAKMTFDVDNPPPKPERTLLRNRKDSDSKKNTSREEEDEEYDHIPSGKMDGQNNNIRQNGREDGMSTNVYSHLNHGQDYSHVGFNPKPEVMDHVYDTTS